MILGCRFLTNVADVNHFDSAQSAEFAEGDTPLVYVQLVDRSRCPASENWKPPGFRYSPAAGATLVATISNIDDAKTLTRTCTQPFPGDASIWQIPLSATDPLRGTPTLLLSLAEGSVVHKAVIPAAFRVRCSGTL
jgi:hypothetical protein